jgi:glycosyltransferase involved in cell wall biosynthesis
MSRPHPLHILMTTDAVGGVWIYATTLAKALCGRQHRVSLVVLGPAPRDDQLANVSGIRGLHVENTNLALEWMDPAAHDAEHASTALAGLERRLAPDVIHLNGYREACAPWAHPVLVMAHSCVASWWQACRGDDPAEPQWQIYAQNVARGLAAADMWVAPTAAFRDEIQTRYAPLAPGRVIWNSASLDVMQLPKQPVIMAAGRLWDEAKNLSALTEIAGDLAWPVRVAGPMRTPDGRLMRADGVEWLGDLPHAELLRHLRTAAVFVAPARYEPFGLTVLEAACAGCALVLADISTFRELWDGAALFVHPRKPDDLRATIEMICRDDAERGRLQQAARRRAQRYAESAMVDAYEAIYAELDRSGTIRRPHAHERVEACA